jgi:tubulin--tyrosine ligase
VVETKYRNIEDEVHQGCHHGRTIILQKYISSPLLYKNRKFDIRCFALVTSINGQIKAYFYKSGYIRTASKEYTLAPNQLYNKFIHLVNDAVQKHCEDYGRYETANKLSYSDF